VAVVDYAFRPASLQARVGDNMVWTNQGRAPHTATAAGVFDTGIFRAGEQRTTTLRTAGTFTFGCTIHPEMTGTLTVAAAPLGTDPGAVLAASGQGAGTATPAAATDPPPAPPATEPPDPVEVSVVDFAFEPAAVRLPAGGTVTWRLTGSAPHTVSAVDASFDSGTLEPGAVFSHRFDAPGTYGYVCAFHPQMTGTIEVTHAPAVSSASEQALGLVGGEAAAQRAGGRTARGSLLAGLLGGAALLAGTGALLFGSSRMLAAADR
jgi:plastocyanin